MSALGPHECGKRHGNLETWKHSRPRLSSKVYVCGFSWWNSRQWHLQSTVPYLTMTRIFAPFPIIYYQYSKAFDLESFAHWRFFNISRRSCEFDHEARHACSCPNCWGHQCLASSFFAFSLVSWGPRVLYYLQLFLGPSVNGETKLCEGKPSTSNFGSQAENLCEVSWPSSQRREKIEDITSPVYFREVACSACAWIYLCLLGADDVFYRQE